MSIKKVLLALSCFVLLLIVSCERADRPIGARKGFVNEKLETSDDVSSVKPYKVASIAGIEDVLPREPGQTGPIDGSALYVTHCSACHQITGQGLPGAFPPLAKSPYVTSDNTERMAAIMLYGLSGPINVLGTTYTSVMTSVGMTANLSNEELSAIAKHIRSSWGNSADEVDPSVFENVRKKYGTRGPFNIQELGEEK